jgi:plastocyanin
MKKITALLTVGALALAACGGSSDSSSGDSASSSSSSSSPASAGGGYGSKSSKTTVASSGGSSEVKVGMVDDSFEPATITGKAGSTVKVELKNTGQREHNFKIDGQKADADVEPGEDATVSVKIPTSGSVQFYCEYHKGLGMVGTVKAS